MTATAQGTYSNGKVILNSSVDWPEGVQVTVAPRTLKVGLDEAIGQRRPKGIERMLEAIDAIEPLELTPEDEAEIEAAKEAVKQVTLAAVRKQMACKVGKSNHE